MKKINGNYKIVKIEDLTKDAYKLIVEKPKDLLVKPGQFFMIKSVNTYPLLNRPISISGFTEKTVEFGIKKVGIETNRIGELKIGESIYLLGPLGNGFDIKESYKNVLLIGGGIGIEPLKGALKVLSNKKIKTTTLLGFRNECFDLEDFKQYKEKVITFSEQVSQGDYLGYPTDQLEKMLSEEKYDAVFTCGPEILMSKVKDISEVYNVETQLLLEEKMACGIGACLGCTCETKSGYKKVCADGPMFYGNEVSFNE
jgi:dihydroorotate dehydrogenase electron transfer subunit